MSKRSRARKLARLQRRHRRCQHPVCTNEGIPCLLHWWDKTPEEFFCWEHAFQHGYCRSCGVFWAGIESFDFGSGGLCEQCRDQIRAETGEDLDEDDFDYGYADDPQLTTDPL